MAELLQKKDVLNDNLLSLLNQYTDGILVVSKDDNVVIFANPSLERILGRKGEDLVGNKYDRKLISGKIQEISILNKEGTYATVEIRVSDIKLGKLDSLLAVFRDISKQKEIEKSNMESNFKYLSLFENMEQGFHYSQIILDPNNQPIDYRYLEANSHFEKFLGLKREEFIGKTIREIFPEDETDPSELIDLYGKVALTGQNTTLEQYVKPLDRWYRLTAYSPKMEHFAIIYSDITEYKKIMAELKEENEDLFFTNKDLEGLLFERAEIAEHFHEVSIELNEVKKELEEKNISLNRLINERDEMVLKLTKLNVESILIREELAESNKSLENFAYIASHDLKEPLRMITSYLQLLEKRYKEKIDKKGQKFIFYALDGAKRMQEMILSLLDYSRIGTKKKEFIIIDSNEVLKKALINLKINIQQKSASITFDHLPKIIGDKIQLISVFQNLIANALKFIKGKQPVIHIGVEKNDKEGKDEWIFSFQDNGIGIDPKNHDKIFNIFKRLHTKEEFEGAGIGLTSCKKIIERHGGEIWLESEVGKGSTFFFSIPIQ